MRWLRVAGFPDSFGPIPHHPEPSSGSGHIPGFLFLLKQWQCDLTLSSSLMSWLDCALISAGFSKVTIYCRKSRPIRLDHSLLTDEPRCISEDLGVISVGLLHSLFKVVVT